MTAVTYDLRHAAAKAAPAAPAKGFWARVFDAFIEARMRQAEREIRMHAHLIPEDVLAKAGLRATLAESEKLPFVK